MTDAAPVKIPRVTDVLPHRPPFVMVDKVLHINPGVSIEAVKLISYNEPYLAGHFPGYPIMPGVLMIEAVAQAAGMIFHEDNKGDGRYFLLVGVDNVKIRGQGLPGDTLIIRAEVTGKKMSLYNFQGNIYTKDADGKEKPVISAEVKLMLARLDM